ncbi:FAD/FMN-containing dehydrogenases [hydrothermal vent metagenome]|uniref:FAD/FMN-containing dehydrogenases n=1 Tax=hydrothermal vent metagenome TaxID=652676 RepID=A0A3B0YPA2_9ZZZZ
MAGQLLGVDVKLADRCCGEAGTLAVSRPDISTQLRFRKQETLQKELHELTGRNQIHDGSVKLLTSCPACQQGLSRYEEDTGLEARYIVSELADHQLGEGWQKRFVERVREGGIERVLL